MILKHIKDKTTQTDKNYATKLQAQITKNDNLKKRFYKNSEVATSLSEIENYNETILEELRKLYKDIAWEIHFQIEKGNILSKSGEPPKNVITNFIIIMDDVNTMIEKTQRFIYQEELEFFRNNFLLKAIFLTKYEAITTGKFYGPSSIQYIFCLIVPVDTVETLFIYPRVIEFGDFNINNPRSFGEFSALRMTRLICGYYDTDAKNTSNASKLVQELVKTEHDIKPFLEMGLSEKEIEFIDGVWKEILNLEKKYHNRLQFDDEALREKEILQCSLSVFFVAIIGQPKFDVYRFKENVIYQLQQIYDIEVKIQNSTDNKEKIQLRFSIDNHNLLNTKLDAFKILNFLMAKDLKGSICVKKSHRVSTEMATIVFWRCFRKLNLSVDLEREFELTLALTDFESLFQIDVVNITENEVKVAWFMYNAGYIKADRLYKEGEKKYVKLIWTNHQKRLSFIEEKKCYILNK